MKYKWLIEADDIAKVTDLLRERSANPFVQWRMKRNLNPDKPKVTRDDVWKQVVVCLLTSQTRAGPNTPLAKFTLTQPFPLNYPSCLACKDFLAHATESLTNSRATRFPNRVANFLAINLRKLEDGFWSNTMDALEHLRLHQDQATERKTADFIADSFKGLGPKQSRNLLQCLGLTRYEIPIDSRVTDWLNGFGFPIHLSPGPLSDRGYYCFVLDAIQELCQACDVIPCVLDAAIFSIDDGDGWTEEKAKGIY
jgi:hypothetical protein